MFDLLSHFRVQLFSGMLVLLTTLLIGRRYRTVAALAPFALLNLAVILPLYLDMPPRPDATGTTLRVLHANANSRTGDPDRVADLIEKFKPDIVHIVEFDESWRRNLADALDDYPCSVARPRDDNFGIALYTRLPMRRSEIVALGEARLPTIIAEVETDAGLLTLVGTHPLPPVSARYSRLRDEQLTRLGDRVLDVGAPVLLLGDLNATPWSHAFRDLLDRAGLRDSERGFGVQPTWPAGNLLLGVPIDHALHSPDIVIRDRRIGPDVGSDHLPLLIEFALHVGPREVGD